MYSVYNVTIYKQIKSIERRLQEFQEKLDMLFRDIRVIREGYENYTKGGDF